ncbi:helix-turn-helix transcriptional regulator [Pseudomonas taetrolens]|uniref:helix-turn-helix transcriptional regulator n=1 Tax=Pseudomonas taetrolens TaxID=47884 RepID=UPI003F9A34F9
MTHQTCKSATSPQAPFSVPVDINAKRTCHPAADPAAILIRMPEVMGIVGLARPTIYKLLQQADSDFPLPVKLSSSNARGAPEWAYPAYAQHTIHTGVLRGVLVRVP